MSWNPQIAYNDLPLLPPANFVESPAIFRQTTKARVALEALRQTVSLSPNTEAFALIFPILEAKSSSEIENVVTTITALFQYADASSLADSATKEALHYQTALRSGIESLKKRPICVRTMTDVCSALRDTDVSVRRLPGTYIGSPSSKAKIYTPPAGEQIILEKLENLSEFLNAEDELDPLVKMAIAHYQFEAIHPFADGNGRTGRVLNMLYLVEQQLLDLPVLYLSKYIIENKTEYYKKLLNVTREQAWEDWILFMLKAVESTATWTRAKVGAIVKLEKQTIDYINSQEDLSKIYTRELVDVLFQKPYCRVANLVDNRVGQRQTAMKYLKLLADHGILETFEAGREKLFINRRLMELLSSDTHEFSPL